MNTKLLKQKILDLAIRGKLTDQRKSDGTARELLEQISASRHLERDAKSAKSKNLVPIDPLDKSEAPFEIPDNWEWVKLGDVAKKITDGTHHSPINTENGEYMYVTAKNIKDNGINLDNITYVSSDVHKEIYARCNPEKGDVLLIKDGATTGIVTVNNLDKPFSLLSSVALIKLNSYIKSWYLAFVIRSSLFNQIIRNQMKGVGITRLILKQIENFVFPLPPLAEQQRIVEKIEEAFAEIDAVEKNKELLKTHIKQTRQKILDLAIHGKLVPQDENDEPARILLEKILQEKALSDNKKSSKKKKTDDIATSDNRPYKKNDSVSAEDAPFDIPNSWEWIKIKDICETFGRIGFRGYTKKDLVEKGQGAISLSPSNIIDMGLNFDKCTYISWFKYEESPEIMLNIGDIVVVKTGSSYGKNAIVDRLPEKATLNPQLMVLKQIKCNHNYLCDFLNSNYFRKEFENLVNGTAIPTFSQEKFSSKKFPLPPLAEQKRIASKIESLFSILDAMEEECD